MTLLSVIHNTLRGSSRLLLPALSVVALRGVAALPPPGSNLSVPLAIQGQTYMGIGSKAALTATTQDPSQSNLLRRVQWYEGAVSLYNDTAAPFQYDFTNSTRGTHIIKAIGYDSINAVIGTVYRTNFVLDVRVVLPSNSLLATSCGIPLLITANVAGADSSSVSSVEWYLNNTFKAGTARPYQYTFTSNAPSVNAIRAEAYHSTGWILGSTNGVITVAHGPIGLSATQTTLDYLGGSYATITASGDCLQNLNWQRVKDNWNTTNWTSNSATQTLFASESPGCYVYSVKRTTETNWYSAPQIQIVDRRPTLWAAVSGPAVVCPAKSYAYSVYCTGWVDSVSYSWINAQSQNGTNATYGISSSDATKEASCVVTDSRGSITASFVSTVFRVMSATADKTAMGFNCGCTATFTAVVYPGVPSDGEIEWLRSTNNGTTWTATSDTGLVARLLSTDQPGMYRYGARAKGAIGIQAQSEPVYLVNIPQLTLSDNANPSNFVVVPPDCVSNLVLNGSSSDTADLNLSGATSPAWATLPASLKQKLVWRISGPPALQSTGALNQSMVSTLSPTFAQRVFLVEAGFDCDGNGLACRDIQRSNTVVVIDTRPPLIAAVSGSTVLLPNKDYAFCVNAANCVGQPRYTWINAKSSEGTNAVYRSGNDGTLMVACAVADDRPVTNTATLVANVASVTSVTMDRDSFGFNCGCTATFTAAVSPALPPDGEIEWLRSTNGGAAWFAAGDTGLVAHLLSTAAPGAYHYAARVKGATTIQVSPSAAYLVNIPQLTLADNANPSNFVSVPPDCVSNLVVNGSSNDTAVLNLSGTTVSAWATLPASLKQKLVWRISGPPALQSTGALNLATLSTLCPTFTQRTFQVTAGFDCNGNGLDPIETYRSNSVTVVDTRPPLIVSISGPGVVIPNSTNTYGAAVTNAIGTVSYTWNNSPVSHDATASYAMPDSGNSVVSCSVSDGGGRIAEAVLTATVFQVSSVSSTATVLFKNFGQQAAISAAVLPSLPAGGTCEWQRSFNSGAWTSLPDAMAFTFDSSAVLPGTYLFRARAKGSSDGNAWKCTTNILVVSLDSFSVASAANAQDSCTAPPSGTLYLPETTNRDAAVSIAASFQPAAVSNAMLWNVAGQSAQPASGKLGQNTSSRLAVTGDNRTFVLRAGFDTNSDTALADTESAACVTSIVYGIASLDLHDQWLGIVDMIPAGTWDKSFHDQFLPTLGATFSPADIPAQAKARCLWRITGNGFSTNGSFAATADMHLLQGTFELTAGTDVNGNNQLDTSEISFTVNLTILSTPPLAPTVYGPLVVCPNKQYNYSVKVDGVIAPVEYRWLGSDQPSTATNANYTMPGLGTKTIACEIKDAYRAVTAECAATVFTVTSVSVDRPILGHNCGCVSICAVAVSPELPSDGEIEWLCETNGVSWFTTISTDLQQQLSSTILPAQYQYKARACGSTEAFIAGSPVIVFGVELSNITPQPYLPGSADTCRWYSAASSLTTTYVVTPPTFTTQAGHFDVYDASNHLVYSDAYIGIVSGTFMTVWPEASEALRQVNAATGPYRVEVAISHSGHSTTNTTTMQVVSSTVRVKAEPSSRTGVPVEECMEGRELTFTATALGFVTDPPFHHMDFTFNYQQANGTNWSSSDWSFDLIEDNTQIADNVPAGNTNHYFDTPINVTAVDDYTHAAISTNINVRIYELWIEFIKDDSSSKPWKAVVGEPIAYSAIASSDCTNWSWDMPDGFPDAWNPTGGVAKTGTMAIPYSDLARAHNAWFGNSYGTVTVKCEDEEGINRSLSSSDMPEATNTLYVFFDPDKNVDGGIPTQQKPPCWFFFWKDGNVIADMSLCAFTNRPVFGMCDGQTVFLGLQACTSNYGPVALIDLTTNTFDTMGSGVHLRCVAESIAHEYYHLHCFTSWGDTGIRPGHSDSDGLPDSEEALPSIASFPVSATNNPDTFNYGYGGGPNDYSDQEVRCGIVELTSPRATYRDKDWSKDKENPQW